MMGGGLGTVDRPERDLHRRASWIRRYERDRTKKVMFVVRRFCSLPRFLNRLGCPPLIRRRFSKIDWENWKDALELTGAVLEYRGPRRVRPSQGDESASLRPAI
jgi:hypothetical protein